jgi:DNA-binding transcriptional ArsR family regulator
MAMNVTHVRTDQVFKSLADPTRLALLERLLRDGEQSVVALTARAGVSQPAVSKHLAVLKRAGLVRDRRDGRETRYRARPEGLAPVIDWMKHYTAFWGDRADRLEDLLRRMDP